MDQTFACPHCGLVSNIEPAHVGQKGPCRGCGKEITVPFPKQVSTGPVASRGGSGTSWLVGCTVAGVIVLILALLACGGLFFLGFSRVQILEEQLNEAPQRIETQGEEMAEELEKELDVSPPVITPMPEDPPLVPPPLGADGGPTPEPLTIPN